MTETSEQPQRSKNRLWWLKWVTAILVLAVLVWEVGLPIAADRWALTSGGPFNVEETKVRQPEWFWRRLGVDWETVTSFAAAHAENFWLVGHMRNLESIALLGIEIDDADLHHLSSLKNLKYISISGCPAVTPNGVRELSEELPDCHIYYYGPDGFSEFGPIIDRDSVFVEETPP